MTNSPRPSATIILLRNGPTGLECLLMKKMRPNRTHGDAWVFPGGRIEPEDRNDANNDMATARAAAIRETREEANVSISGVALVYFSHWTTPEPMQPRYATWFFLAEAPADQEVRPDGEEMAEHRWLAPAEALRLHHSKQVPLSPPSFVSLSQLQAFDDVESALASARNDDPIIYLPRLVKLPDGFATIYAGDSGYETGDVDASGARHRVMMLNSGWEYQRDY